MLLVCARKHTRCWPAFFKSELAPISTGHLGFTKEA